MQEAAGIRPLQVRLARQIMAAARATQVSETRAQVEQPWPKAVQLVRAPEPPVAMLKAAAQDLAALQVALVQARI